MSITILCILLAACIFGILTAVFNDRLPIKWLCTKFGWHVCPKDIWNDGCSGRGACPRCGKEVMRDSQGNWFTLRG